jgi:DNA-directed RNA polymerase subunit M/transcription elongation factor TFIIS
MTDDFIISKCWLCGRLLTPTTQSKVRADACSKCYPVYDRVNRMVARGCESTHKYDDRTEFPDSSLPPSNHFNKRRLKA